IFIEFHEAIDKTNKLSLLLTTSEAGDNRLSSLPVLLDYTVSSLGSEELISLKLSWQGEALSPQVARSQTEEIWTYAWPPTALLTLLLIGALFGHGRRRRGAR
ncbi:hypothetical protein Bpfe_016097, partial [Biomphalaria pfeifferi]